VTDVEFLQWALPRAGLRWAGFRKVRRQVLRRVRRRLGTLGLSDLDEYREFLETHPSEWDEFVALTPVTISRFYRDRAVFEVLEGVVLPALGAPVRAWSAACASGEEPYTLALLGVDDVLATDIDPAMLRRADALNVQAAVLERLAGALRPGGALVAGLHEQLPAGLEPWPGARAVFRFSDC